MRKNESNIPIQNNDLLYGTIYKFQANTIASTGKDGHTESREGDRKHDITIPFGANEGRG